MSVVKHFDIDGQIIDIPIPTPTTVNDGTLIIQKNGTNVATFTANQSGDSTANITVPTKVSELTNDSGFITDAGVTGVKGSSETNYRTGNVNITKSNIGLGSVGNFKAVSTVASQGLTDTEKSNARANIGAGTSSFSGSYNDLTNKPTIPTVNNGTLTIQKNGTNVATFTANQSSNATANITVPTVNNGTLTIQKNGSNVATFTANQSGNATANITVPTKTSQLTNDDDWVLLATSTGNQVSFGSFIGSVYHTILLVTEISISAGVTFTFNDILPILSFPNTSTSRLLRTGYYDATNDYVVCQIQVMSSVLKLDTIFTPFTVTSKSTKLYVKK